MSTRGVFGISEGKGWYGIFNNGDSYPTYGGKEFWKNIKKEGIGVIIAEIKNGINPIL